MNSPNTSNSPSSGLLKSLVVAVALALPVVAVCAGMDSNVTTRTDPNLVQHNGRDSVYALPPVPVYQSAQAEPQRYGRAGGFVGTDRVEMSKSPHQADSSPRVKQAQGMVGTDKAEMSKSAQQANSSAPVMQDQGAQEGRTAGDRF